METKKGEELEKGYSKPLFIWVTYRAHLEVMISTRG